MTLATTATANDILNTVAVEVGLDPQVDAFSATDRNFVQLRYLINTAVKELTRHYNWEFLVTEYNITTVVGDSGIYSLPSDFLRMIDQTGWERNNRNPINGLSAQEWQYLKGRDLVSETIRVNFRVQSGMFEIYPQPASEAYDINFEYVSKNCVTSSASATSVAEISVGADVPMFDELLLSRMVKVKWYEAKGMDTTKAQDDFNQMYELLTASNASSPVLNAGSGSTGIKMLNTVFNLSDTNYGNS